MIKDLFVAFVRSGSLTETIGNYTELVKGQIITETVLDHTCRSMVMQFLNETCIGYSFGTNLIISRWQNVFKEGNDDLVFYKIPKNPPTIFFYNGALIKSDDRRNSSRSCTIKYIRNTVNLSQLVKDAREYCRPTSNVEIDEVNYHGYSIIEHSGSNPNPNVFSNSNSISKQNEEAPCDETSDDVTIYKNDTILNYTRKDLAVTRRKTNPFDDFYFPQEVTDLVADTNEWLKRRDWFISRGLPWKRGILIYGPGGTGKSSFAKTLGQKFGIEVHHMYLSNMTDIDFKKAWATAVANAPSIVLLEDFDAVFNKRVAVNPKSKLNFDTVLNTISGIQDSTGIILIITTNKIECIDEAIGVEANTKGISSRPGRIDKVLYLGAMNDENRRKLITKILLDWPDLIERAFEDSTGYTPAQVQEVCIQYALQKLHEEK